MKEEIPNLESERKERLPILNFMRRAIDTRDKEKLRTTVDAIQKLVHGRSKTFISPMNEVELERLLETGKGEICVGTGTSGQRIYIEDGEIFMPLGDERSQRYGKDYHNNFKNTFDLDLNSLELRVRF